MRKLLLAILALAPMIAVSIVETPCAAQQPAVVVPVPPPLETGALTHLEFGERQPLPIARRRLRPGRPAMVRGS